MKSSLWLLVCIIALVLSLVVFFGSFLPNPHHPLDYLYGSLTALGMSILCGWIYFMVRRTE